MEAVFCEHCIFLQEQYTLVNSWLLTLVFGNVMFDLSVFDYTVVGICAFLVGISKTGVPGTGILVVPLLASVIPAKESVGLLLPLLIAADIFAVGFYRRDAVWSHLLRLIPWAACGVVIGYFALGRIDNAALRPIIGVIILGMLSLSYWWKRNSRGAEAKIPSGWWFAAGMGLLAGITTMMANAAGPIMIIYLLAMKLPKQEFIGTRAWYFLIMNSFKVPFSANLGLITAASFKLDLMFIPVLAVGALLGVLLLKWIPQKFFNSLIQILAALSAVKLIVG